MNPLGDTTPRLSLDAWLPGLGCVRRAGSDSQPQICSHRLLPGPHPPGAAPPPAQPWEPQVAGSPGLPRLGTLVWANPGICFLPRAAHIFGSFSFRREALLFHPHVPPRPHSGTVGPDAGFRLCPQVEKLISVFVGISW